MTNEGHVPLGAGNLPPVESKLPLLHTHRERMHGRRASAAWMLVDASLSLLQETLPVPAPHATWRSASPSDSSPVLYPFLGTPADRECRWYLVRSISPSSSVDVL